MLVEALVRCGFCAFELPASPALPVRHQWSWS
jgi:hypothetical protein